MADWLSLVTWVDVVAPYYDAFFNKRPVAGREPIREVVRDFPPFALDAHHHRYDALRRNVPHGTLCVPGWACLATIGKSPLLPTRSVAHQCVGTMGAKRPHECGHYEPAWSKRLERRLSCDSAANIVRTP
jgi:hypothetical protein